MAASTPPTPDTVKIWIPVVSAFAGAFVGGFFSLAGSISGQWLTWERERRLRRAELQLQNLFSLQDAIAEMYEIAVALLHENNKGLRNNFISSLLKCRIKTVNASFRIFDEILRGKVFDFILIFDKLTTAYKDAPCDKEDATIDNNLIKEFIESISDTSARVGELVRSLH